MVSPCSEQISEELGRNWGGIGCSSKARDSAGPGSIPVAVSAQEVSLLLGSVPTPVCASGHEALALHGWLLHHPIHAAELHLGNWPAHLRSVTCYAHLAAYL